MDVSSSKKVNASIETKAQVEKRSTELAKERVVREARQIDQQTQARAAAEQRKVSTATSNRKPEASRPPETRPRVSSEISQAMIQNKAQPKPKADVEPEPEPSNQQLRSEAAKPIEVSRDGARTDQKLEF